MTDERYTFVQDIREKKRTARGYYNKVRQGGRMKLPSDYLTAKEKKKMNGQVYTYSLADRLSWEQFKSLPNDLQMEYIDKLRRNKARAKDIREWLCVSQHPFEEWCRENNVVFKKGKASALDKAVWETFCGLYEDDKKAQICEEPTEQEAADEQPGTLENLLELLKHLVGTGAKLTIEVTI